MKKESQNNIIVVVVTFNRLELLKRCFQALNHQIYKDFDIVIVNNGSTDGTKEWLDELPNQNLHVIHQENCGGAGGFYAGMKYGYDHGYNWIWMMDDDGVPQPSQLHYLLLYATEKSSILSNALVCDVNNPKVLAFDQKRKSEGLPEILVNEEFRPFNGTFIHRELIDKIGFIKREMFIWGDENEYTFRARKHGVTPIVITKALHYHPKDKGNIEKACPPILNLPVKVKPVKLSHNFYRNMGYNQRHYSNTKEVIGTNLSYPLYFIRKGRIKEMMKFITYYWRGFFNLY